VPKKYATAMEVGGTAYGLVATAYDGRPIKLDGNVEHPHTGRGSTAFVQASLLELYDPDRSRAVERREGRNPLPATWASFEEAVAALVKQLGQSGRGLRVLSEATTSPTIAALRRDLLARFPDARWHEWEPLSRDNERAGTRMAFGRPMRPHLKLAEARVIATFDADLFGDHPESLRLARDFATGRDPDENAAGMNRHYAVESAFSITGAGADHRLPLRSELILPFAMALRARVTGAGGDESAEFLKDERVKKVLDAIVEDLGEHNGRSIVIAGRRQPAIVHAIVADINEKLGAVGQTLDYVSDPRPVPRPAPHHSGARKAASVRRARNATAR
jgi:molybdopterin-containing oxidoreductase family iron-sulfur binding subunit